MTTKLKKMSKRDNPSAFYGRMFVRHQTEDIFDAVLLYDKAQAEYPHKVHLMDLVHEAAKLLAKKRGISV